jgi:hypothetical protein
MTANGVAFRFGVNNDSTGATAQRADRPPLFADSESDQRWQTANSLTAKQSA